MKNIFTRPYPTTPSKTIWIRGFLIGGFVFLFLYAFKPFGLDGLTNITLLKATLTYGLITFSVVITYWIVFPMIIPKYFDEDHWTIGKEVICITMVVLSITLFNYAFNVYQGFTPFNTYGFLFMFLSTAMVSFIIIFALTLLEANRKLKKNLVIAQQMTSDLQTKQKLNPPKLNKQILLSSDVERQGFEIDPDLIVCLASDANYIICTFFDELGNTQEKKIRNRMKEIEGILAPYVNLFRCHRAFIVNLDHVESVSGNAKGYLLKMTQGDLYIPVARSKGKALKSLLSEDS